MPVVDYRLQTMTETTRVICREENLVSFRVALIMDDGYILSFFLLPRPASSIPNSGDDLRSAHTFLYRRKRSVFARICGPRLGAVSRDLLRLSLSCNANKGLRKWLGYFGYRAILTSQEKDIRPVTFDKTPEFKLLWSDSGNSVALYLNGEPWAFIRQDNDEGYSKGVLRPTIGKPWNQELFEKTFNTSEDKRGGA